MFLGHKTGHPNKQYNLRFWRGHSDGFFMAKDAFGVKRMTLHKDCTINGRRIADMTKEELDAWIAEKAKQDKIITIL